MALAQTLIDLRYALCPLTDSPKEGLGAASGETAKRRDEPLTPSPSLADKVEAAARAIYEYDRDHIVDADTGEKAMAPWESAYEENRMLNRCRATLALEAANALEARAARAPT